MQIKKKKACSLFGDSPTCTVDQSLITVATTEAKVHAAAAWLVQFYNHAAFVFFLSDRKFTELCGNPNFGLLFSFF